MTLGAKTWAVRGSGFTIAVVGVAYLIAPTNLRYDAMLVVATVVMTIAIVVTAAFAAENLREFREMREAEFTPIVDVRLDHALHNGKPILDVHLRNIGRGYAAGLEAFLWWSESDQVAWVPHHLKRVQELLGPGEGTTGSRAYPRMRFTVRRRYGPDRPDIVLQLRYRDALRRSVERFEVFELVRDEELNETALVRSHHPVPQELTSLDGKRRLLDDLVARIAAQHESDRHGLEVIGKVGRRAMSVRIRRDGRDVWLAQLGVEDGVYRFEEQLEEALQRFTASHNSRGSMEVLDPDPDEDDRTHGV